MLFLSVHARPEKQIHLSSVVIIGCFVSMLLKIASSCNVICRCSCAKSQMGGVPF